MSDTFENPPIDVDTDEEPVNEADVLEQHHPIDKDPNEVTPRVLDGDVAVPEADAWEQSLPAGVDDEY